MRSGPIVSGAVGFSNLAPSLFLAGSAGCLGLRASNEAILLLHLLHRGQASHPSLRATFSPAQPRARRDALLSQASTVSSCALGEQEGQLATPFHSSERAHFHHPPPALSLFALNRNIEGVPLPVDQQKGKIGWLDRIGQSLKHGEVMNGLSIEFKHDVTGLKT